MPTLLHLNVSPRGDHSISRRLSAAAVENWKKKNPEGKVVERDLTKTAIHFVDLNWIMGAFAPEEYQTPEHKKALEASDELIAELLAADEIVIGTPMYNFAVPALLKAWIDQVVRAGKTFRYTATGPEGLAGGRKVVVAIASAGVYTDATGMAALNHEAPYLRFIFGFIGITDVTFVHAGGTMAVGEKVSPEEFLAPYVTEIAAAV